MQLVTSGRSYSLFYIIGGKRGWLMMTTIVGVGGVGAVTKVVVKEKVQEWGRCL